MNLRKKRIGYGFQKSVPVLCGYLFLGTAFGVLLQQAGYSVVWALFISLTVYSGSMQFALVTLLSTGASLPTTALMTLFVNCRHMFYGISLIEKFKRMAKGYFYMIFSLTDETYSLLCSCRDGELPEDPDNQYWFWVALFDHCYWICGCMLGVLLGKSVPFDLTGIDFSMTALFAVLLVDQIRDNRKTAGKAALIGAAMAVICLLIFGSDAFLLPTLLLTVVCIVTLNAAAGKKAGVPEEKKEEEP